VRTKKGLFWPKPVHFQVQHQEKPSEKPSSGTSSTLLEDRRFSTLFTDPDFEIVEDSEQYKQLAPMMKKLEAKRQKLERRREREEQGEGEREGSS
jgi:ribosome biogenesis protein ENP2